MRHRVAVIASLLLGALAVRTAGAAADPEAGNWIQFTDPNEHAFTIEVPSGWHTEGGLVRRGPIDYPFFLRLLSPDKQVMLILGDPGPAYFFAPWYGAPRSARPYVPGPAYARQYVESALRQECQGLEFVSGADRPDVANGPLARATRTHSTMLVMRFIAARITASRLKCIWLPALFFISRSINGG